MNTESGTPRTDQIHIKQGLTHAEYRNFAKVLERETNELRELLEQSLEYLEEHTDAGFIDQGFKFQKLLALISKIEEKTK
jgi:hypothetical protein